ncbi:MAG: hypothetical protein CL946_13240 [Ectothiorhodospiraceae bacterium]|nr:hypothetical protein [Ectothiorhodospiraceae bacterium]
MRCSPIRFIVIALCLAFFSATSQAQQLTEKSHNFERKNSIGVALGYGLNLHSADFPELPGVANCCTGFTGGSGTAPWFGLVYNIPPGDGFGVNLQLTYVDASADLIEEENIGPIGSVLGPQDGIVEHRLYSTTAMLEFRPTVTYTLFKSIPLTGFLGPAVGFLMTNDVQQEEAFTNPPDAAFDDGSRVRNQYEGEVPEGGSLYFGLATGLRYHTYLSKTLTLVPELSITAGMTSLSDGVDWTPNFVRGGLALMFTMPDPPPPPPQQPPPPPPVLAVDLDATVQTRSGTEVPEFRIVVEEIRQSELFPILPFIFFDQQSSDLSKTSQALLGQQDTRSFDETNLPNNTLDVYSHVLNIVGSRMLANPEANVTLTGHNNMTGEERNNTTLSRSRADAVESYLTDVWNIDPSRITVRARNYPREAPERESIEGQQEARRVEIESDTYAILAPVQWEDVQRKLITPNISFKPDVTSEAGVRTWNLLVTEGETELALFDGTGDMPAAIPWVIDTTAPPEAGSNLLAELEVQDNAGQTRRAEFEMPVGQEVRTREIVEEREGKRIDRFSLILFDFQKSTIGAENRRILEIVKNAITPRSRVTIYGFADRTGNPEYNRNLAMERCQSVQRALGGALANIPTTLEAVGSDRLLFDNDIPEGRNYCRTVQIVVETGLE